MLPKVGVGGGRGQLRRYGGRATPALPTAARPLPTAPEEPAKSAPLDLSAPPKHDRLDPRKRTPGGRLQNGMVAGFGSEQVAGFILECRAFLAWRRGADGWRVGHRFRGRAGKLKTDWTNPPAPHCWPTPGGSSSPVRVGRRRRNRHGHGTDFEYRALNVLQCSEYQAVARNVAGAARLLVEWIGPEMSTDTTA